MAEFDNQPSVNGPHRKPGRPRKSASEYAQIKRKIAEVASELFRSEGYDSVSMRRIAKEIGLTPMALYRYFPSKMAILSCLWAEVFERVAEDLILATKKSDTATAALSAASRAYVEYWLRNRDEYFLVFMSRGLDRSDVRGFVSEGSTAAKFELFYDLIAQATKDERSSQQTKLRGDQLLCGLHGVMHCTITIPGYDWSPVTCLVEEFVTNACR